MSTFRKRLTQRWRDASLGAAVRALGGRAGPLPADHVDHPTEQGATCGREMLGAPR